MSGKREEVHGYVELSFSSLAAHTSQCAGGRGSIPSLSARADVQLCFGAAQGLTRATSRSEPSPVQTSSGASRLPL